MPNNIYDRHQAMTITKVSSAPLDQPKRPEGAILVAANAQHSAFEMLGNELDMLRDALAQVLVPPAPDGEGVPNVPIETPRSMLGGSIAQMTHKIQSATEFVRDLRQRLEL